MLDSSIHLPEENKNMMNSNETGCESHPPYEYIAFISYRHNAKDQAIAKKIQKTIEDFRLPKNIETQSLADVNRSNNRSLGKCFRDEDELAATHSLPGSIKEALDTSKYLIVVCSPETPDSYWMQLEIEEFIKSHSPERVITVLADGRSDESIPPILKSHSTAKLGALYTALEPLAVDLRTETKHDHRDEILRIIATVAGCGYDDLRQRQRVRQRKRIVGVVCTSIAILTVIGVLIGWGVDSSKEHLIAESKQLAALSMEQLSQGNRIEAIETALSALPESSTSGNRPITDEAVAALTTATQINPDPDNIWRPSFNLQTSGTVVSSVSSTSGGWIAVLDSSETISVFDANRGNLRFELSLSDFTQEPIEIDEEYPDALASEWSILAAGADNLLIANRSGAGSVACINADTGETRWEQKKVVVSSWALSESQKEVVIFSIFEDAAILVGLLDVSTGDVIDWGEYDNPGFLEFPVFLPSYLDMQNQIAYAGIGGFLIWIDFANGEMDGLRMNDYMIQAVSGFNGQIIVGSSYRMSELGQDVPYIFQGVINKEIAWRIDGEYDYNIVGSRYQTQAIDGQPRTVEFIEYDDSLCVTVTAGGLLQIIRIADGNVLYSKEYDSNIVGAGCATSTDVGAYLLPVATANGRLDILTPTYGINNGTSTQTDLPYSLAAASFGWHSLTPVSYDWYRSGLLVLLKEASPSNELHVYHLDSRDPDEIVEMSLDELIACAHGIIGS